MKVKIGCWVLLSVIAATPAAAQNPAPVLLKKLTEPQDDYPDVAPSGSQVLFQSNRSGNWQLWSIMRDGSGLTRITNNAFNDRQPAWSPAGDRVAFSSDRGMANGRRAIFIMNWPAGRAGEAPRQLTSGAAQDVHPKWLPDGSGVVFNRIAADGKQADVYIVRLDGTETKIELGRGLNTYASVDRAQRLLIYRGTTTETGPDGTLENSDIFSARLDGSEKRRLTTDPAFDGWPAISPDGKTIAFGSRVRSTHFRIHIAPIEGGAGTVISTPSGYHYTQPAWAPDGRALLVFRWTQDSAGEVGNLVEITLPQ